MAGRFTSLLMQIPPQIRQILELEIFKQLRRFLVIGGIATIISYSVFSFSIRVLSLHYIFANILAFLISITFSYHMNKRWSFEVAEQQSSHLTQYLTLYLFSLVVGTTILRITIGLLNIIPEIAFIISLCFTTVINFVGTKFFVFKK